MKCKCGQKNKHKSGSININDGPEIDLYICDKCTTFTFIHPYGTSEDYITEVITGFQKMMESEINDLETC